jgi:hypothetical protein
MIECVDSATTDEGQSLLPWAEFNENGDAVFQDLLINVWETREGSLVYGGSGDIYFKDAGLQARIVLDKARCVPRTRSAPDFRAWRRYSPNRAFCIDFSSGPIREDREAEEAYHRVEEILYQLSPLAAPVRFGSENQASSDSNGSPKNDSVCASLGLMDEVRQDCEESLVFGGPGLPHMPLWSGLGWGTVRPHRTRVPPSPDFGDWKGELHESLRDSLFLGDGASSETGMTGSIVLIEHRLEVARPSTATDEIQTKRRPRTQAPFFLPH